MGPSSGTLTLRRRTGAAGAWSLSLNRYPPMLLLSALSVFCPMARAKASSGARTLIGEFVDWCSLGKSWYFRLSGCAILQTQGFESWCPDCRAEG